MLLRKIKDEINSCAEHYAENYLDSADFIDGEEPDGSPSVDDYTMHQQALWEMANSVSKVYNFLEFYYDRDKAHQCVIDCLDGIEEYLEELPRAQLPATTTLNRVLNALTSRMKQGMCAYEAFTDAGQDKKFVKDLHLLIMGYLE